MGSFVKKKIKLLVINTEVKTCLKKEKKNKKGSQPVWRWEI